MTTRVYLSTADRALSPDEAKVSVFDRGFLYGDSIYETMRTVEGRPVELERHLQRLHRSGVSIGLEIPFSDERLREVLAATHLATGNRESHLRLVVTRGVGELMLDPRASESPLLVVIAKSLELPSEEAYRRGLAAMIVELPKTGGTLVAPTVKSGNYLNNILALRLAASHGCDDAILCGADGAIAEGATSNVFAVRSGAIETPHLSTGLLPGITRQVICELQRQAGWPVRETVLSPEQLRAADEVFLTSSVRGIMPVTRLDGVVIGDGGEGPVTAAMRQRYERWLAEQG